MKDEAEQAKTGRSHPLSQITRDASGLGQKVVEIDAFLQALQQRSRDQLGGLAEIASATDQIAALTGRVFAATTSMAEGAEATAQQVEGSLGLLAQSGDAARALAQWVQSVHADNARVEQMLEAVKRSNGQISAIATQVNILAVNAKIEAARAGEAGRGFAIVAEAINDLSQQTSGAVAAISETVRGMSGWIGGLNTGALRTSREAESILAGAEEADRALGGIRDGIGHLRQGTRQVAEDMGEVRAAVDHLRPVVHATHESIGRVAKGVDDAARRCDGLIDLSEAILQQAVGLGGTGADSAMITLVQDLARQIAGLFASALAERRITEADLFDSRYRPVPGSDPPQVVTGFTRLTDQILPAVQEPVLARDPRIVFCAAVDRNGYLPTHNAQFSRPLSADPLWNAAHCRNRRMFNDRVGLKAGRNTRPFLLQVYRRDMGGGTFTMMKDLSAPIVVNSRHWGGLRLAYRF